MNIPKNKDHNKRENFHYEFQTRKRILIVLGTRYYYPSICLIGDECMFFTAVSIDSNAIHSVRKHKCLALTSLIKEFLLISNILHWNFEWVEVHLIYVLGFIQDDLHEPCSLSWKESWNWDASSHISVIVRVYYLMRVNKRQETTVHWVI